MSKHSNFSRQNVGSSRAWVYLLLFLINFPNQQTFLIDFEFEFVFCTEKKL